MVGVLLEGVWRGEGGIRVVREGVWGGERSGRGNKELWDWWVGLWWGCEIDIGGIVGVKGLLV